MKEKSDDNGAVRKASGPRYSAANLKPLPAPDPENPPRRNPIHSVLMALPVIMLVAGLYFYYQAEREQSDGEFVLSELMTLNGQFSGLSVVKSGISNQHFLWMDTGERLRGIRLDAESGRSLNLLEKGDRMSIDVAPKVVASRTMWLYRLRREGELLFDAGRSSGPVAR